MKKLLLAAMLALSAPAYASEFECRPIGPVISELEDAGFTVETLPGGKETVEAYASVLPFDMPEGVVFTGMAVADGGGRLVRAILIEDDCTTYSAIISRDLHQVAMAAVKGV
jgi:hypothetical protein